MAKGASEQASLKGEQPNAAGLGQAMPNPCPNEEVVFTIGTNTWVANLHDVVYYKLPNQFHAQSSLTINELFLVAPALLKEQSIMSNLRSLPSEPVVDQPVPNRANDSRTLVADPLTSMYSVPTPNFHKTPGLSTAKPSKRSLREPTVDLKRSVVSPEPEKRRTKAVPAQQAPPIRRSIRLDDKDGLNQFFFESFQRMPQNVVKPLLKISIKFIEPNKQKKWPYVNSDEEERKKGSKRRRAVGEGGMQEPPWWPKAIRHKEPDHLHKDECQQLGAHLLWFVLEDEGLKVKHQTTAMEKLTSEIVHIIPTLENDVVYANSKDLGDEQIQKRRESAQAWKEALKQLCVVCNKIQDALNDYTDLTDKVHITLQSKCVRVGGRRSTRVKVKEESLEDGNGNIGLTESTLCEKEPTSTVKDTAARKRSHNEAELSDFGSVSSPSSSSSTSSQELSENRPGGSNSVAPLRRKWVKRRLPRSTRARSVPRGEYRSLILDTQTNTQLSDSVSEHGAIELHHPALPELPHTRRMDLVVDTLHHLPNTLEDVSPQGCLHTGTIMAPGLDQMTSMPPLSHYAPDEAWSNTVYTNSANSSFGECVPIMTGGEHLPNNLAIPEHHFTQSHRITYPSTDYQQTQPTLYEVPNSQMNSPIPPAITRSYYRLDGHYHWLS
ncbi:hypothetical protein BT63DRAFT_251351 [Microthyrium microscopicum]|uniref:Subtelomeric hrmA-associated cluster protein AFUB-079030/YDR124W-like helical bundle domain-containing protein n=1 Tax=Microthyrium microscopicum TaxID=703497 RepID=A0A6A6UCQ6_9PEZI|nr:hypothetical protein BT63DRAFT_251351 [Microthyrium microscopicum]